MVQKKILKSGKKCTIFCTGLIYHAQFFESCLKIKNFKLKVIGIYNILKSYGIHK